MELTRYGDILKENGLEWGTDSMKDADVSSLNAQCVFPTDDSLLKMLYLATMDITKKWTGRRQDWGLIHSQLEIFFADRLP